MNNDTRIVCSVGCTWWDSIYKASRTATGLPCCPFCSSVLLECPDEPTWWDSVHSYTEENNDPDYPTFIEWIRGQCYQSWEEAYEIFRQSTQATGESEGS